MPSDAALRAGARTLARLGQPSTLDGVDCGPVHLEMGVAVVQGDVVLLKTVATVSRVCSPQTGAVLVHPDGTYVLDVLFQTNGVNDRFVLLAT